MSVVHVVAGSPGNRCGVLDYTNSLVTALTDASSEARCKIVDGWSLGETLGVARAHRADVIHVQYPSLQMGYAPWWGMLGGLNRRTVVTLHEFSIFSRARKLYCLPVALLAKQIIFSNAYERQAFLNSYPFAAKRCTIIPVGNNIPVTAEPVDDRPRRLIYFGQIGDDKGLDLVLEAVAELRAAGSTFPIAFIGAVVDPASPIVKLVEERAGPLGIDLRFNLSSDDVSSELARSTHAYLPFPDGISDKRGSALACLKHGVAVLTTHSQKTPDWLRVTTTHCESPSEAVVMVQAPAAPSVDADALANGLAERTWPAIAERHASVYRSLT